MTTPTNRPPDGHLPDDGLEARLRASFERAEARAKADPLDRRLVTEALDRGHRNARGGMVWRAGLVFAAVALLSLGTAWLVGGRPAPSPSPIPSLANLTPSGLVPADQSPAPSGGSQAPVPEPSFGTQTPELPGGATFPPSVDGQPVYAVGGPAERHIAQTTDASEFYVSGWRLPLKPSACVLPALPSMAPDGVTFDPCATLALFAGPGGGASVSLLFPLTNDKLDWASIDMPQTRVRQIVVRAHTHDGSCAVAYCASPVVDQVVLVGAPAINPTLVAASPPPNVAPIALAISNGYDYAQGMFDGNGGSVDGKSPKPVFMSAEFGTAAVLGDVNSPSDPLTTWEWKVVFASADGNQIITIWEDAATAASDHSGSQTRGPDTGP